MATIQYQLWSELSEMVERRFKNFRENPTCRSNCIRCIDTGMVLREVPEVAFCDCTKGTSLKRRAVQEQASAIPI